MTFDYPVLSSTFTLMFLMSLLARKCFLETHWSNSCLFEQSPTVSFTSVYYVYINFYLYIKVLCYRLKFSQLELQGLSSLLPLVWCSEEVANAWAHWDPAHGYVLKYMWQRCGHLHVHQHKVMIYMWNRVFETFWCGRTSFVFLWCLLIWCLPLWQQTK